MNSILLRATVILSLLELFISIYRFIFTRNKCRYGREVKATDSKSVSILERRFESYYLRNRIFKETQKQLENQKQLVVRGMFILADDQFFYIAT